ncbi:MAG TPA: hypothetical protein VMW94_08985 [Actinomycetes bacterium]|nr:hypothetical protein [Actinomycetes bacterium]
MNHELTLLEALRAVPGVASADIEPDDRPEGAGTLRLQLSVGADEVQVATSVNRVLREQFGLAVDANRVQVVEESVPMRPPAAPEHEPDEDLERELDDAIDPAPPRPMLTAVPGYVDDLVAVEPPAPPDAPAAPGLARTSETVAEYGSAGEPEPKDARPPRILIQRMQLVSAGLGVTTEVTLAWAGEPFAGESAAAATPSSVHRSVAQATLRAVESVVGGLARFELEQLEINQLGPDRAVVVVVSMLTKVGSERLTGVSVVREDVRQAVIRATLDSLNRRIESLLQSA